ncbi:MAG TPA: hypothetical protein VHI13_08240 [Candidatus Kapabacteria bacterium]|nr:hypothetical protein [Candidatus Kapabacteria bacterium]
MARLNMVAVTAPTLAANGNRNVAAVLLSVTDTSGNGVAGIVAGNFTIGNPIVGAGGASVVIDSVAASGPTGAYLVRLLPNGANNWADGLYLITLDLASGADDGQTVCSLVIP